MSRAVRPHVDFVRQACRESDIYFICVYVSRTIYYFIINGRIKAYINRIIGLFLVSQTSLPTTIGASDQDPLLSTGGGRIGKRKFFTGHKS